MLNTLEMPQKIVKVCLGSEYISEKGWEKHKKMYSPHTYF